MAESLRGVLTREFQAALSLIAMAFIGASAGIVLFSVNGNAIATPELRRRF